MRIASDLWYEAGYAPLSQLDFGHQANTNVILLLPGDYGIPPWMTSPANRHIPVNLKA